jgi:SAM-dependent methyltransferase
MHNPAHNDADGIISDEFYDARIRAELPDKWKLFEYHVNKVVNWGGSKILDLGAGEGHFSHCCKKRGLDVFALEGSSRVVEHAQSLGVDAAVHNLKNPLPLDDDCVDFVMYHDVYEHVHQSVNDKVFSEVQRVLVEGGSFWAITTCKYDFVECRTEGHINNPTPSELATYGEKVGFQATILRPGFNISLFTPFGDEDHPRMRQFVKRYRRHLTALFCPVWLPILYLNRSLRIPLLDAVGCTSNVMFNKTSNSGASMS